MSRSGVTPCQSGHFVKFEFGPFAGGSMVEKDLVCPWGCGARMKVLAMRLAADLQLPSTESTIYRVSKADTAPCRLHPDVEGRVYEGRGGLVDRAMCNQCEGELLLSRDEISPDLKLLARNGMNSHFLRHGALYFPRQG